MRREDPPDAIGLSAIDLISCAFIAVLILNMLSEDRADSPPTRELTFVRFESPQTNLPVRIGVRISSAGQVFSSWDGTSSSKVKWLETPGSTVAVVEEGITKNASWGICLLDGPPRDAKTGSALKAMNLRILPSKAAERTVVLQSQTLFRAKL